MKLTTKRESPNDLGFIDSEDLLTLFLESVKELQQETKALLAQEVNILNGTINHNLEVLKTLEKSQNNDNSKLKHDVIDTKEIFSQFIANNTDVIEGLKKDLSNQISLSKKELQEDIEKLEAAYKTFQEQFSTKLELKDTIEGLKKEYGKRLNKIQNELNSLKSLLHKQEIDFKALIDTSERTLSKDLRISKEKVLSLLTEKDSINFDKLVRLTPRVLPGKAEIGTLMVDKKGDLKFYKGGWKTVKIE